MNDKELKLEKDKVKRIQELIGDAIHKVKNQAENNEKILTEKSNTLNWVLTLTTILFAFLNSSKNLDIDNCFVIVFVFFNKVIFFLLTISFIVFKTFHQRFLRNQNILYSSLDTHHLELKYNVHKIKDTEILKDFEHSQRIFNVVNFFNAFTSLKFRFYKVHDDRDKIIDELYKKAEVLDKILRINYLLIISLFSIYASLATIIMFI